MILSWFDKSTIFEQQSNAPVLQISLSRYITKFIWNADEDKRIMVNYRLKA